MLLLRRDMGAGLVTDKNRAGDSTAGKALQSSAETPVAKIKSWVRALAIDLLYLLLKLVNGVFPKDYDSLKTKLTSIVDNDSGKEVEFLLTAVMANYSGSMSEEDRVTLRIVSTLFYAGKAPPAYNLRPPKLCPPRLSGYSGGGGDVPSDQWSWILTATTQSVVYSTLMQFPLWRSALAQPLIGENATAHLAYHREMELLKSCFSQISGLDPEKSSSGFEKSEKAKRGMNSKYVHSNDIKEVQVMSDSGSSDGSESGGSDIERNSDSDSESSSGTDEADEIDLKERDESVTDSIDLSSSDNNTTAIVSSELTDGVTVSVDTLIDVNAAVLDPCFWVLLVHQSLSLQEDLSVRQLANSGLLSIVVASLASDCVILRTYALSCLRTVHVRIRGEAATHDAAFRDRPQLLLLLNFIRNSIEPFFAVNAKVLDVSTTSSSHPNTLYRCPRLPFTSALFCARAAMHVSQSSHELFGRINKYLLSKPYCDVKDVPLYDHVLVDGDVLTDTNEQLAVLRLIRDGLRGKDDHINLCRKNAYLRLINLFPQLSKDVRIAHAVLDVFEKALAIPAAARYLFERCGFITWLGQMSSIAAMCAEAQIASAEKSATPHGSSTEAYAEHAGQEHDTRESVAFGGKAKNLSSSGLVTYSYPSLPSTARILGRVVALLRKCTAADYLLTAQGARSSARELLWVLHTLVADAIAADRVLLTALVPTETLKQCVALCWDMSILHR